MDFTNGQNLRNENQKIATHSKASLLSKRNELNKPARPTILVLTALGVVYHTIGDFACVLYIILTHTVLLVFGSQHSRAR